MNTVNTDANHRTDIYEKINGHHTIVTMQLHTHSEYTVKLATQACSYQQVLQIRKFVKMTDHDVCAWFGFGSLWLETASS